MTEENKSTKKHINEPEDFIGVMLSNLEQGCCPCCGKELRRIKRTRSLQYMCCSKCQAQFSSGGRQEFNRAFWYREESPPYKPKPLSLKTRVANRLGLVEKEPLPKNRLDAYLDLSQGHYQFFVGYPVHEPDEWVQVYEDGSGNLKTSERDIVPHEQIHSYLVTHPGGEYIDGTKLFWPWPKGTFLGDPGWLPTEDEKVLDWAQLEVGEKHLQISYSESGSRPRQAEYYTTTLKNISNEPITISRFAFYIGSRGHYEIEPSGTYGLFDNTEFRQWYRLYNRQTILPGEEVSDPHSFSHKQGLWVYYGQTESGIKFVAGAMVPKKYF